MAKETKKETELDKARGTTADQQANRAYHEGEFQTHDPVTGEKRGPLAHHATPEGQGGAVGDENVVEPPKRATKRTSASANAGAEEVEATDAARELAKDEGVDLATVKGTGTDGRITVDDVRAAL